MLLLDEFLLLLRQQLFVLVELFRGLFLERLGDVRLLRTLLDRLIGLVLLERRR